MGHVGQRLISQLAGLPDPLVAWPQSSGAVASEHPAPIDEVKARYCQYQFANLRH